jgi:hypothetical protein
VCRKSVRACPRATAQGWTCTENSTKLDPPGASEPLSVQTSAPVPFTAGCVVTAQAVIPGGFAPHEAVVKRVKAGTLSVITIVDSAAVELFV